MLDETTRIALSTREAAKAVSVCEKTLLASDAPRVKIGRKLLWLPDQLREWLRERANSG